MTKVFRTLEELRQAVSKARSEGKKIGFVPTMGALHSGHLSLVREAKAATDLVVCSIFVNPTQFNNPTDLERYPRQLEADTALLETENCDVVWAPDTMVLYPDGQQVERVDYGSITAELEGAHRPGHFDGVVTIVRKLLRAVEPDMAFFGEKDFQQLAVIRELARREFPEIRIVGCPIIRSEEGLALSSRNQLLSDEGRKQALVLSRVLEECADRVSIETPESMKAWAEARLHLATGVTLEYAAVVSQRSFEPLENWDADNPAVVLLAAFVEDIRLIDNVKLGSSS